MVCKVSNFLWSLSAKLYPPPFSTLPVIPVNTDSLLFKQKPLEPSVFMSIWAGISPAPYKTAFLLGMAGSFLFKVSKTSLIKASCLDDISCFHQGLPQLKRFGKTSFSLVHTMKKFGVLLFSPQTVQGVSESFMWSGKGYLPWDKFSNYFLFSITSASLFLPFPI